MQVVSMEIGGRRNVSDFEHVMVVHLDVGFGYATEE